MCVGPWSCHRPVLPVNMFSLNSSTAIEFYCVCNTNITQWHMLFSLRKRVLLPITRYRNILKFFISWQIIYWSVRLHNHTLASIFRFIYCELMSPIQYVGRLCFVDNGGEEIQSQAKKACGTNLEKSWEPDYRAVHMLVKDILLESWFLSRGRFLGTPN